jgi:hypothetical protein
MGEHINKHIESASLLREESRRKTVDRAYNMLREEVSFMFPERALASRGVTTAIDSILSVHFLVLSVILAVKLAVIPAELKIATDIHQYQSRDGSVGIATGYGLDDQGVGIPVPVGVRVFTSPCRRDRLWGPPTLLSNGYRELFPRR